MNILFIISSLKHGGAEKQTILDANVLSEKHNVYLITFKEGELRDLLNQKVKLVVINKKGYIKTAKVIRGFLEKEKIDVVNASLFASMILAVMAAEKINIPVIWYFHSHEFNIKLKSKIAYKYYSKKNCLKKILFVSKELMEFYDKIGYYLPKNKQDVLYNTYTMNPDNPKIEKENSSDIIIGYIGRIVSLKRVNLLIEFMEYLLKKGIHNVKIKIVGDGDMKNALSKYVQENNLEKYIEFLGYRSDVERYYNEFDVFALPSQEECLSVALIDACVKSVPSIAFNVGGNNEIIVNNETGYIVESKDEFFDKLNKLINDEQMRKVFGEKAKKYCAEKFDKVKRYNYLDNLFHNLVRN